MRSIILLVLLVVALPASAQTITRPRQLNEQLRRAETALVSGSSLLEAKARVDRVVAELPEDAEARVLRAEILLSMARYEEATVDARRATELQPSNGSAHLALGEAAFQIGDVVTAEAAMNRAAQILVDNSAAHVRLSRLARRLGRLEQAIAFARIAVALSPENAVAHYELARAFTADANTDAAASILGAGLREGLLVPDAILSDSLLALLAQHPDVRPYIR